MDGILLPGLAPSTFLEIESFLQQSPFAKKRFKEASEVIGYSLQEKFIQACETDYEVNETAFLANSIALVDHFKEMYRLDPDLIIGPSFGGMSAAVHSGSLTFQESVWVTHESAITAKEFYSSKEHTYQTHFIYNLSIEEAKLLVEQFNANHMYLELVGYLEKVVCLCGTSESIKELKEKLNHKPKCYSLHTMEQPIHSSLLTELKKEIATDIYSSVTFKRLNKEIISDVNGSMINSPHELQTSLLDGYDNPVRWDLVRKTMTEKNVSNVYVVGPKNLFSQLLKNKINTVEISPTTVLKAKVGS